MPCHPLVSLPGRCVLAFAWHSELVLPVLCISASDSVLVAVVALVVSFSLLSLLCFFQLNHPAAFHFTAPFAVSSPSLALCYVQQLSVVFCLVILIFIVFDFSLPCVSPAIAPVLSFSLVFSPLCFPCLQMDTWWKSEYSHMHVVNSFLSRYPAHTQIPPAIVTIIAYTLTIIRGPSHSFHFRGYQLSGRSLLSLPSHGIQVERCPWSRIEDLDRAFELFTLYRSLEGPQFRGSRLYNNVAHSMRFTLIPSPISVLAPVHSLSPFFSPFCLHSVRFTWWWSWTLSPRHISVCRVELVGAIQSHCSISF